MAFERYAKGYSGLRTRVFRGLIYNPLFYCDDTNFAALPQMDQPYLKKAPVVKFSVSPLVNWVGQNFTWDISNSTSATSTLSKFNVMFSENPPPDLIDQDWNTAPKTGTFSYATPGERVISARVEDLLQEKSQVDSITIQVLDITQQLYQATTDQGVYKLSAQSGAVPTQVNTGLTGGFLKVNGLKLNPFYKALPPDDQHIWIATDEGLALTIDGAANWTTIDKASLPVPENQLGDTPAPVNADLHFIDIEFSLVDPDTVYATAIKKTSPNRTWCYFTTDYGATWNNQQVIG